jgi:hypothetical protein
MARIFNFAEHGVDGGNDDRKAPLLVMPPPRGKRDRWLLWRARLFLAEFVFVCLVVGILLITAPWTPLWSTNSLLADLPRLRELLMNNFVRGLISGIGLIDIGLAVTEVVRYREG